MSATLADITRVTTIAPHEEPLDIVIIKTLGNSKTKYFYIASKPRMATIPLWAIE